jgi:hypothetical protein
MGGSGDRCSVLCGGTTAEMATRRGMRPHTLPWGYAGGHGSLPYRGGGNWHIAVRFDALRVWLGPSALVLTVRAGAQEFAVERGGLERHFSQ